jgi:alpha-tubulin suppressor-like RCC1 family protein
MTRGRWGFALVSIFAALALGAPAALGATDDTVLETGYNAFGQLGNNSTVNVATPVAAHLTALLNPGESVVDVSPGIHTLAVTSDGRVFAWGRNDNGELGDGTNTRRDEPVEVDFGSLLDASEKIIAVSSGYYHSAALSDAGNVYTWGYDGYGELGDNPALASKNTPQPIDRTNIPTGVKIVQVVTSDYETVMLGDNGKTYGMGYNGNGMLGDSTNVNRAIPVENQPGAMPSGTHILSISGRYRTIVALTDNSSQQLYAWGYNGNGQVGTGSVGGNIFSPVAVDLGSFGTVNFTEVAMGAETGYALDDSGEYYTWGLNSSGEYGNGTTSGANGHIQHILAMPALKHISSNFHTVWAQTLADPNHVIAWGYGPHGQIGNGAFTNQPTPQTVILAQGTKVSKIAGGFYENGLIATLDASPTVTIGDPSNGDAFALNASETLSFSCDDDGPTPPLTCTSTLTPPSPGAVTHPANGAGLPTSVAGHYSLTVVADDTVHTPVSKTVTYDVIAPPTATITKPLDTAHLATAPTSLAQYACAGGKAPVTCVATITDPDGIPTTPVPNNTTFATTKPGSYSMVVVATDALNQTTTVTSDFDVSSPPSATINAPTDTQIVSSTAPGAVDFSCGDGLAPLTCTATVKRSSGVVTPILNGATLPTTPGTYTLIVTAKDSLTPTPRTTTKTQTFKVVGPPTVDITAPQDTDQVAVAKSLTASYTCGGDAAPVACTGKLTRPDGTSSAILAGGKFTTTLPGQYTLEVKAVDDFGAITMQSITFTAFAAPTITATSPVDGGLVTAGTPLTAQYTCTAPAGIVTCAGTQPSGGSLDTSQVGVYKVTISATDGIGQAATKTITYTVVAPPPPPIAPITTPPAAVHKTTGDSLLLSCIGGPVAVLNAFRESGHVRIIGASTLPFAGKSVSIRLLGTGKIVGTTTVGADGSYSTTVPLPPKSMRDTEKGRYTAQVAGGKASPSVKLERRLNFASVTRAGTKVTIRGHVSQPFARPRAEIVVRQQTTCAGTKIVGHARPENNGDFALTVTAPPGVDAVAYRMSTRVRKSTSSEREFTSYSLGQGLNLF